MGKFSQSSMRSFFSRKSSRSETPISRHVAIVGDGKTGKSTFIANLQEICGVKMPIEEAELAGIICTKYRLSERPDVVLWEIPYQYDSQSFLRQHLHKFSLIVVLFDKFLRDWDIWWAKEAAKVRTEVIYVRTKFDFDLRFLQSPYRNLCLADAQPHLYKMIHRDFYCRHLMDSPMYIYCPNGYQFTNDAQSGLFHYVMSEKFKFPNVNSASTANVVWTDKNVGVTGAQLVGKSSLINALRQIKENGVGAAPVSEDGTNLGWQSYAHPHQHKVTFHEMPYGSEDNSDWLGRLDVVCLLIGDRFLSTDLEMFNKLTKLNRPILLVRTKVDLAVRQVKRRRKEMTVEQAKSILHSNLMASLERNGLKDRLGGDQILFVSAWELAEGNDLFNETELWPLICTIMKM